MNIDVQKITDSLNAKIKEAAKKLRSQGVKFGKAGMWAAADLTDDEILVMAAIHVNNERESIRWEGFLRDDKANDKAIDKRFKVLKEIITQSAENGSIGSKQF
jgi:hypothetical protein